MYSIERVVKAERGSSFVGRPNERDEPQEDFRKKRSWIFHCRPAGRRIEHFPQTPRNKMRPPESFPSAHSANQEVVSRCIHSTEERDDPAWQRSTTVASATHRQPHPPAREGKAAGFLSTLSSISSLLLNIPVTNLILNSLLISGCAILTTNYNLDPGPLVLLSFFPQV